MTDVKTNPALIEALKASATLNPPPQQIDRQRLSFVMGVIDDENDMTREEVQDAIERQEGRKLVL